MSRFVEHGHLRFMLFRSNLTRRFPKTNSGSSTILCDELDAGRFQGALNCFEVVCYRDGSSCFEIPNGTFADLCFVGELSLRKFDESARGAALSGCHSKIVTQTTIFNKDTE
jgi:hypothetical protein